MPQPGDGADPPNSIEDRVSADDGEALRPLVRHVRDAGRDLVERLGAVAPSPHADPARHGTVGTAPMVSGTEQPRELADAIPLVERAFAFMDLCGFTKFIATNGEHAAIEALSSFRSLTRELGTRRGVRVAKWLGDGAMLVGVDVGPTIAAAAELIARYEGHSLALRGGLAHGRVLIFDGDDYIGRPTNLAARLCQAARPGELLSVGYPTASLPPWIRVLDTRSVTLQGLGRFRRVQILGLVADLELPTLSSAPHPDAS
jgi:class 3 adenylate cyclase